MNTKLSHDGLGDVAISNFNPKINLGDKDDED